MIILSENKLKETPLPDESEWGKELHTIINKKDSNVSDEDHMQGALTSIQTKLDLIKNLEAEGKGNIAGRGSSRLAFYIENGSQANTIIKFAFNNKGLAQNKVEHKLLQESNNLSDSDSCIIKMIDYDKDSDIFHTSGNPMWIQLEPLVPFVRISALGRPLDDLDAKSIFFERYYKVNIQDYKNFLNSFAYSLDEKKDLLKKFKKQSIHFISQRRFDSNLVYDTIMSYYKDKLEKSMLYSFVSLLYISFSEGLLDLERIFLNNDDTVKNMLLNKIYPLLYLEEFAFAHDLAFGDIGSIHNWGYRANDPDKKPIIFDMGLSYDIYQLYYAKKNMPLYGNS